MSDNPLARAMDLAAEAYAVEDPNPSPQVALLVLSWTQYLEHVNQRWEDAVQTTPRRSNLHKDDANEVVVEQAAMLDAAEKNMAAVWQLLPRVEPLEVRAVLAEALGHELEITHENPDPGRDWSRVRGELFKPSGKWMYSVWLDYSGLRRRGVSGEGPHGWHFDGSAMARLALMYATDGNRSGVTMREIPNGWRLFVPDPPQGYPLYVIGGRPVIRRQGEGR